MRTCICIAAGINGFKTNHSLRVTATTCLYQAGVSGQIIMETTGRKSTDGDRSYKHTSTQRRESVSDILSQAKRPELDLPQPQSDSSYLSPPLATLGKITADSFKHLFTFNHCSDLKINIQLSISRIFDALKRNYWHYRRILRLRPPPLCMLALGKSREGAYTWDPCDNHYRPSNATWTRDVSTFSGCLVGKTREKQ